MRPAGEAAARARPLSHPADEALGTLLNTRCCSTRIPRWSPSPRSPSAASARRLLALGLSSLGLVLVLAGAGAGTLDPLGATLALAAACVYSAYILVGAGVSARVRPDVLCALVCSGAAVTLTAGSLLLGDLRPGALTAAGWGWLACLSVISTVAAIGLFFAGLARVGPSTASILSTVEPLTTVVLAFLVFGETLSAAQLGGGALVLGALVVLAGAPLRLAWPSRTAAERVSR